MGAIERCSKLLQVRLTPFSLNPLAPPCHTVQHWSSGFESALSSVLNDNREAEASSSLQLQAEIQSRDRAMTDLSHQLDALSQVNAQLTSELAVASDSSNRAAAAAAENTQRLQTMMAEAEARCSALEAKMEEQTKRHEEYAGFIAEVRYRAAAVSLCLLPTAQQECSVKDDLIRDLEAERVAHCSALADLRSSSASLASTVEAVTTALAHFAPGDCLLMTATPATTRDSFADVDQGDALALSHAVAELVTSLRNDNHRSHTQLLRVQVVPA